mmetsp:Transcript_16765/g.31374  ORF Transcript_16765/g.31374 Transcript_16765/m.31374 type:complete len:322 (+) Transcript_16765:1539-2504(+)
MASTHVTQIPRRKSLLLVLPDSAQPWNLPPEHQVGAHSIRRREQGRDDTTHRLRPLQSIRSRREEPQGRPHGVHALSRNCGRLRPVHGKDRHLVRRRRRLDPSRRGRTVHTARGRPEGQGQAGPPHPGPVHLRHNVEGEGNLVARQGIRPSLPGAPSLGSVDGQNGAPVRGEHLDSRSRKGRCQQGERCPQEDSLLQEAVRDGEDRDGGHNKHGRHQSLLQVRDAEKDCLDDDGADDGPGGRRAAPRDLPRGGYDRQRHHQPFGAEASVLPDQPGHGRRNGGERLPGDRSGSFRRDSLGGVHRGPVGKLRPYHNGSAGRGI